MYYPVINTNVFFEKFKHLLPTIKIIQVGAGGNGGYLVQKIARTLNALNRTIDYILIDGDIVEEHNLQRQPFLDEDVGLNKAAVLVERYSSAYDIQMAFKDSYIYDISDLQNVCYSDPDSFVLLIGAVDNNASRQIMHDFFMTKNNIFYIDAGIDGVEGETEEEKKERGYTGQVVAGLRFAGKTILEPIGLVYPNILEDKDSMLPGLACGLTVVNYPQRMQTNELAALVMHSYFQNFILNNEIVSHYINFNALTMRTQPTWIKKDITLSFD